MATKTKNANSEDGMRHEFFKSTLENLQEKFEKNFAMFKKECKKVVAEFGKYTLSACNPVHFDEKKHKYTRTTIQEYLQLLPDEDSNSDLKSKNLIGVDVFSDGDVLFRAILSLIGCSREGDLIELKVRCLVDAVCNQRIYINGCEELEEASEDSDQTSSTNWSTFIHEKEHITSPNIITVYIFFALAKLLNIPIRCAYPIPQSKDFHEIPYHPYNLVNRIFKPPSDQHSSLPNTTEPIVIMWWPTHIDPSIQFDHVIPLFPTNQNIEALLLAQSQSNSSNIPTEIPKAPIERRTGIYILIGIATNDSQSKETLQRIKTIKTSIIELIETIATNSNPYDVIEINTCNEQLTEPPLIPFCQTKQVFTEENRNLINNIQFIENKNFQPSISICTAIDKLTRQSTYYDRFYFFVDTLFDKTKKSINMANSVIHRCKEYKIVNPQIIHFSNEKNFQSKDFENPETVQIHSFNNNQKKMRWKKIIHYGNTQCLVPSQISPIAEGPISYIEPPCVRVQTDIQYIQIEHSSSIPIVKQQKQIDTSINTTENSFSSSNSYRVPTPRSQLFLFNPKFS